MKYIPMTVQEAYHLLRTRLQAIYDPAESSSIAKIALEDLFNIKNVVANRSITEQQEIILHDTLLRLLKSEPIQYIVGFTYFYGIKIKVNPAVLIPRPETEELVYWILQDFKKEGTPKKITDIGTGSGCIPLALKNKKSNWNVSGVDVSKEALAVAQENSQSLKLDITWKYVDILNPIHWDKLPPQDIIVSNPPYIPLHEKSLMEANVLDYEPTLALFIDNHDPLLFYHTIADFALKNLHSGGVLYFEMNENNTDKVKKMLLEKSYQQVILQEDINGKPRMIKATKP